MKRIGVSCLLIFVAVTSLGSVALSCTLLTRGIAKFDETEFIFIGQVVGYTEPLAFDDKKASSSIEPMSSTMVMNGPLLRKTVGIRVRVTEKIHVPHVRNEVFEIYTYDLGADCSIRGVDLSAQEAAFPMGSEVRVIAREAIFIPPSSNSGVVRLEARPGDGSDIVLNFDSSTPKMTTAVSVLDYERYYKDLERNYSASRSLLGAFEARKDLLRLKNAKSQAERNSILERLIPSGGGTNLELSSVFDTYAANASEATKYFEAHLRMTDPDIYRQYTVLKRVWAELERRGYSRKRAEEATKTALEAGTEIEFEHLLKASLMILTNQKEPNVSKPK